MNIFTSKVLISGYIDRIIQSGAQVGFVPTMGALHAGHLSLINQAKTQNDHVVCSIYVNPTQFNQQSDFDNYPKPLAEDIQLLEQIGCDTLFLPLTTDMYDEGEILVKHDFGKITQSLEGAYRPGHFDGVIAIVRKLLDCIRPHQVYFGQKDYQQCMVIAEMIRYYGIPVQLHTVPTLREPDGLAMSSRNVRLSAAERKNALALYEGLNLLKHNIPLVSLEDAMMQAKQHIESVLQLEYLAYCDARTLEQLGVYTPKTPAVILAAAWCGSVRLIDNLIVT